MKETISRLTRTPRHQLVRLIAPSVYSNSMVLPWGNVLPRPAIRFLKARGSRPLTGVEIGVGDGANAESILRTLNVEKLFLVDPYEPYVENEKRMSFWAPMKTEAHNRLRSFTEKTVFLDLTSDEAVNRVPDGLDFVYVDGNHTYEYVTRDLENYFPKLRPDGVLCGHDFWSFWLSVVRAVCDFANKHKELTLKVKNADWWFTTRNAGFSEQAINGESCLTS